MARLQKKKPAKFRPKDTNADKKKSVANRGTTAAVLKEGGVKKPAIPKKTLAEAKIASTTKPNFIQKSIQFLREVKLELRKVVWPSRKQTMGSTLVVIILVLIFALFFGIVDFLLSWLIQQILN